jgi:hypothetical protein
MIEYVLFLLISALVINVIVGAVYFLILQILDFADRIVTKVANATEEFEFCLLKFRYKGKK